MVHYKLFTALMTAITLAALGGVVPSPAVGEDTTATPAETAQSEKAIVRTVSGTVTAVVPVAKTLLVEVPRGATDALVVGAWVTDHTVIKEGEATKRLEDLKVGDQVRMKFERVDSGDIALTIVVKQSAK